MACDNCQLIWLKSERLLIITMGLIRYLSMEKKWLALEKLPKNGLMKWKKKMTDKILVSRKELEKLRNLTRYSFLSPSEGGVRRFQDKSGAWVEHYEMFKIIEDLLDKAEVSEPIGEMKENGVTWFKQNPHAYTVGTKFYTTPQPSRISELEAEVARLTAIIEDMKVVDNVSSK